MPRRARNIPVPQDIVARGDLSAPNFTFACGLELDSPTGRIHLDRDRQAVVSNYLSRVVTDAKGKLMIRTLRVVPNVEQTFGGYFGARSAAPSRTDPLCRRAAPPPWAR